MASYSTNQFKNGLKVMIDGEPNNIVETEFVKPGKGQAFVRIKVKNLFSGRVVERTLKSGESLEAADVMETSMQYLYKDGEVFHFMDPSSYEQYEASAETLDTAALYLKEEDTCAVTLFNNRLIAVTPPNHVVLEVVETDPGLKGDTSSGGNKPATMETGAVVRVPLFVKIGDQLKIDTRTGDYVSRA